MSQPGGDDRWSRPNQIRDAATPNVLHQRTPLGGLDTPVVSGPTPRPLVIAALLLLAGVFVLAVVPLVRDDVSMSRDSCAVVDDLLENSTVEPFDVEPIQWMPRRVAPEFDVTENRPTDLETVVAGRVNPGESRIELVKDGFVDGYEQFWDGPTYNISFTAQRFASTEGARAFQAFANRFACRFANEAFRGPRGSIGLQIRYAAGQPIGEQVSWVSGTTRVLVSVRHPAPPPDHERIESAAALVGVP